MTVSTEKSYKDHVFTLEELDYWIDHPSQFFLPEHFEVVEGRVVEIMATKKPHGFVAAEIAGIVRNYVRANKLGRVAVAELGFRLKDDPLMIRCPDAAFVIQKRLDEDTDPQGYMAGAPDLAVEVVSPGDTNKEVATKVREYLAAGGRLVWVVYPAKQTVHVFKSSQEKPTILSGNDMITGENVIPGFSCKVSEFFE